MGQQAKVITMEEIREPYHLFDDMMYFYNALIKDIEDAKKTIFIELFRFHDDPFSKRILLQLIKALERGVKIKILVDGWGTPHATTFFKEFVEAGGYLRIWDKMRFTLRLDVIIKSHHRDHRKIFTFDNEISYFGSANISDYNLLWRELMLRVNNKPLAQKLSRIFQYQYLNSSKILLNKKYKPHPIFTEDFEILRDTPTLKSSIIKKRYIELINQAKSSIVIESPYFLPSSSLRYNLEKAMKRGVKVIIITPMHSDVKTVDILRDRYLAFFYEKGAAIYLYKPTNLHSKLFVVDEQTFSIGSSNFDYRSFKHQYEITVLGNQPEILEQIRSHLIDSVKNTVSFDYDSWKNRSWFTKLKEHLIIPIRELL